ncbi:MAG: hypothetical protein AAB546_03290 [Patescibacteria group bacterium]
MKKYAPFVILVSAFVLRFATVGNLMTFTPDEVYQAYLARTIISDFHIIWIGISAGSFGMFLGPFWIYVLTPLLYLSKGDPIVMGYLGAFLGVLTTYVLFWLGKTMFNWRVGVIASIFYSFSALIVYYDQKGYPSGVSLLSVLMLASLYLTKRSAYWWIAFAFVYGFIFHVHLSLALLALVAMYIAYLRRQQLNFKIIFLSFSALVIMLSPLIVFDYFHKASNVLAPLKLISTLSEKGRQSQIPYHLQSTFDSFGRVLFLPAYKNNADEILYACTKSQSSTFSKPPFLIALFGSVLFFVFCFSKNSWKQENKRLILLSSLVVIVPYVMSQFINPYEYYLLGFFPLYFLMLAVLIEKLKLKFRFIAYLALSIFVCINVFTVTTARNDFGLAAKKKLITKTMQVVGQDSFELTGMGDCHKYEGWRYLFSVYGTSPQRSSEDNDFAWLYKDEVSSQPVKYSVVVSETRQSLVLNSKYKLIAQEGGFSAYILEY